MRQLIEPSDAMRSAGLLQQGQPRQDGSSLYRSAADLEGEEQIRREAEQEAETEDNEYLLDSLARYVRQCWEAARQSKEVEIKQRLLGCLRQRSGVHDPEIQQAIKEKGGSDVYMMLTDEKCSAAESWLEDILLPPDDKPWAVSSTPVADLPREETVRIQQQALQEAQELMVMRGQQITRETLVQMQEDMLEKARTERAKKAREEAKKTEDHLDDILAEADWRSSIKEFLYYFCTYPAAFMKGPVLRSRPELKWPEQPGEPPTAQDSIVIEFDVPSPFDIFPSPHSRDVDDGYLIERHSMTRSDLYSLIDTDSGFDNDAIRDVLRRYDEGSVKSWLWHEDETREHLEGRSRRDLDPEGRIDALQFWGSVSGDKLMEWGLNDVQLDPEREYEAEVWLVDNTVLKATLNPDPLGRKPYFKASFRTLYGQFWGVSLPEIIKDAQVICNSAARNLVDNMAISSGPQVGVDAGSMPPGEDYTQIFPWRVWPFDLTEAASGGNNTPIWFFQPPSMAGELMQVYEKFSVEADNKSGIPKYSYGQEATGGPLSTATGFSMMMNNASRGIKKVVRNIDYGIITPSVSRLFEWHMLYDEEFQARHRGDIKIMARGSHALVAKEQSQMRLVEVLQTVLGSQQLSQLAGMTGIASIFRKVLQGVDVGVDDVIPSDAELQAMEQMMQNQQAAEQQQGAGGAQRTSTPQGERSPGPASQRIAGRTQTPAGEPAGGQDGRAF
ncbi:MAG: portal protein [Desulfohalobiaceae bacterium]